MTTPANGKSFGPSGWVAVAGIALNGVLYALQQSVDALPGNWGSVVMAAISVLTVLGVYHAPNEKTPRIPVVPPVVEPPAPSFPQPAPDPAPAPPVKPPPTHLP